jgi:hypothetical protein
MIQSRTALRLSVRLVVRPCPRAIAFEACLKHGEAKAGPSLPAYRKGGKRPGPHERVGTIRTTIRAVGGNLTGSEQSSCKAEVDWPSVDDDAPGEQGGPTARAGFNYQDEIAAGFLIEMLESRTLVRVHCETHDDILLVWSPVAGEIAVAEFVQVKSGESDKLWSVADLCQRKNGAAGSSIFEKSLGRDKHREISRFRVVTVRPVVSALKVLCHPCGSPGRTPGDAAFTALHDDIAARFPSLKSPKGNGLAFWLENCTWEEAHDEATVHKKNLLRLIKLGVREGFPLLPDIAEAILLELLARAKAAGVAKWIPDRDKKIIHRTSLHAWWQDRLREFADSAASASGGKLAKKMEDARLPDDLVNLAVELRRGYAAALRTSQYMKSEERELLQDRVRSEVLSLRARFAADQLATDAPGFHARCVERMDAINRELNGGDRSAFLKGCMYDIADRCLLRFTRSSP